MDKILKRLRSAMTDVIINLPAPLILGFSRLQKAKTTQITTITSYCNLSTFSNHSQWSFFFFWKIIFSIMHIISIVLFKGLRRTFIQAGAP